MNPITIKDLTESTVNGTGVFDELMKANKAHLLEEFNKGRITGQNYSTVYLGSLDAVMNTALAFLLQKDKVALEAELLRLQGIKLDKEIQLADAAIRKAEFEIELVQAQVELTKQQKVTEIQQELVLKAQECKLKAEYDLTLKSITKAGTEIDLLVQKVITEKAQTQAVGIDENSVVGRQKALYRAQTVGFKQDAAQKYAKMMIDTWNSRRITDEGTVADSINKLNDVEVGTAVTLAKESLNLA